MTLLILAGVNEDSLGLRAVRHQGLPNKYKHK